MPKALTPILVLILGVMLYRVVKTPRESPCTSSADAVAHFLDIGFEQNIEEMRQRNQPVPDFYSAKLHDSTVAQVQRSLRVYQKALDSYDLSQLSLSFNGGKDSLVMLILYLSAIEEKYTHCPQSIKSVYINKEELFAEQNKFLEEAVQRYQLDYVQLKSDMKQGFEEYLAMYPEVEAIMVGIRRIDPYGGSLKELQRTDHGWPDLVRVHPVLDWTTSQVWYFLRSLNVPYCTLYDDGYTSLGGVTNTIKNPLLKQKDGTFLPAYTLNDDENERLSRVQAQKL